MNPAYKLVLLSLPLTLAACSVLEGDKVDYKSSVKATPLSVPPDLTQLPRDNRYATPGVTVSATGFQNATQASGQNAVASTFPGLRIEGHGLQRWLAVDLPPEKIWPVLKSFWEELGLEIIMDDAKLGIMETNWAENRAKLPQDFFRRTFGKVLDSLSSTNQLDKYRTRLERHASGGTEIYISHRGLDEVFRDDQRIKMAWQIRPSEPELEYEMLRRLMLKLGAPSIQSEQIIAAGRQTTRLDSREGQPIVIISEGFDRAWRRVGLTLDRTGFTVEDRDRSQGTYFVRYVEPNPPGYEEPGFFARLFGAASRDKTPQKYRILVRGEADSATVSVLNTEGQPEMSGNAQRILKVISDDLR
ncbi:MAG: outer membrane protein assembly factor BamC [Gammaproteobacteria bacterium]|nr:outer membrane protein assembly factor BamC [Gammaproteobacteria bacterium]